MRIPAIANVCKDSVYRGIVESQQAHGVLTLTSELLVEKTVSHLTVNVFPTVCATMFLESCVCFL